MTHHDSLTLRRHAQYTPVTAITHLTGSDYLLSGSATFLSLNSTSNPQLQQRWKLFERERIHRIVTDPTEVDSRRKVIVVGGKEAGLIKLIFVAR